ncbi:MAG: Prokaryotic metallothionein, partial [Actinomycetota bacterium]|nr:Prokaryotic metallothionein [Actinomycetota bacterium]
MAQCEVCGNEYDKAFEVSMPGGDSHTFDSFE